MIFFTDDPVRDAERYQAEQDRKLDALPKCAICGEPIQDESALYLNGEWICDECVSINTKYID